jgi:hypothetical protein
MLLQSNNIVQPSSFIETIANNTIVSWDSVGISELSIASGTKEEIVRKHKEQH